MKKLLSILTSLTILTTLVACGTKDAEKGSDATDTDEQTKIAVIRNLPSDDHTTQFLSGAVTEGEALGYKVDTFISNGDDAKFQELVAQQIEKGYDGLIISHGKTEYSTLMLEPALEKGMKIVTFDTSFKDGAIPSGITSTSQDDYALAELSLNAIVDNADSKPVRIIKLWYGPGIPPLDRRDEVYRKYEEEGLIETVEFIGPSTLEDVQGEVSTRVAAVLPKYKDGDINAIWGSWDEMAKGGLKALEEANRTDIRLISIDVSNQDINLMTREGSVWEATAAVDPALIGTVNMRILAKKLKGEETPETYDLAAHLIKSEDLTPETTMSTLSEVIPGWGKSDDFNEPWMDELREKNK